jgi:hypothetical protein
MLGDGQLLLLVLTPVFVVGFAFVLLYRKLDDVLHAISPAGTAPTRTRPDDVSVFVKWTAIVALITIFVVYTPSLETVRDMGIRAGFVLPPTDEVSLATWVNSANDLGRYQWHAFDLENNTRYPVIECALYENTYDLQIRLLGTLPEAQPGDAMDPMLQSKRQESRRVEERLRLRARKRCVLNAPDEHVILDGSRMTHLTAPSAPSISEVVRAKQARLDNFPINPVDDVLLARDGSRFYRVNIVVANRTRGLQFERRVVSEQELLRAPQDWYRNYCGIKAFKVFPCLCPAHLGYVNSGFYFRYAGKWPEDECDQPWQLWARARVVRSIQGASRLMSDMTYEPYPTDFPLRVNEKLNVTGYEHASMTQVEFIDMKELFDSAKGQALLEIHEPDWLAGSAPLINVSASPLLSVLPLDAMVGPQGPTIIPLNGEENACFGYCLHLDQVILEQAGLD